MGLLQAVSDKGKLRENNEDYAFCTIHPKDENIRLLLVADGMGGKSAGDIASQEIAADIEAWFYHEDIEILRNIEKIGEVLTQRIKKFNKYLIEKYGKNYLGTTLTMAITGKDKTLLFNIGDSRGYLYKNKKLIQVTEDDSGVWTYYKNKEVSKDDLRFFPTNNYITACVGLAEELCVSRCYVVDNDYDCLILLTDGVTDILADSDIKKIIDKSEKRDILKKIILEAVNGNEKIKVPLILKSKFDCKFSVPVYGRDNASGVIFIKN